MWGTYSPIVEGIIREWFRKKNKKMLIAISNASRFHFSMFQSCSTVMDFPCKCNCKVMKQNKIKDACREWQGDSPIVFGLTGWGWEEYFSKLHAFICKECFKKHWHGVRYRTLESLMDHS
jgi:hypothetical protein